MGFNRIHVFYSGRVQGVGFRYTAHHVGSMLGLGGWVRNLGNGKVEVVCEGEERDLKRFLDNMAKEFPGQYIMNTDVVWEKPTQEFDRFEIRF